jgi:hypothetical protein
MSKWLAANKLAMYLDKTNITKFTTINVPYCPLSTGYNNRYIEEIAQTKFLGLQMDSHLNWKTHVDELIPELSAACYAVGSLLHISNTDMLRSVYYAYFHSLMKYGIIF